MPASRPSAAPCCSRRSCRSCKTLSLWSSLSQGSLLSVRCSYCCSSSPYCRPFSENPISTARTIPLPEARPPSAASSITSATSVPATRRPKKSRYSTWPILSSPASRSFQTSSITTTASSPNAGRSGARSFPCSAVPDTTAPTSISLPVPLQAILRWAT
ncbi:hypothetical protein D9M72_550720 [compost metagenome]